jgi:toxin CcdB
MAQFDIFRFADNGLVVDLQADALASLATRLVTPLYPASGLRPIRQLNPVVMIGGEPHIIAIQEAAAVRLTSLGAKAGSAAHLRDKIIAAVDVLITGV